MPLWKPTVVPQKDTSSFEDFSKLDLRTGTILSAEENAKSEEIIGASSPNRTRY